MAEFTKAQRRRAKEIADKYDGSSGPEDGPEPVQMDLLEPGALGITSRRGRGRPAGAVAKTKEQLRRMLASRGVTDPLLFLGEVIMLDARAAAAEMGCDMPTVLAMQIRAAGELAPYLHGKIAAEAPDSSDKLPILHIHAAPVADVGRYAHAGDHRLSIDMQQYQEDSVDGDPCDTRTAAGGKIQAHEIKGKKA